jgi:hypothetical protein
LRTPTLLAIASLALITTGPYAQAPARPFVVEPLALAVPLDSGEARLTTTGDRVFLSWIEHGSRATLRFAERTASGWTPPLPIVSGTNLMVNAADVPSVHLLPNGTFVAQWLQQHGADPEAYDLRLARSADAGKSWTPAVSPHHDRTATQHGFASLFPAADGGFGLIWLDGRSGDEMALRATSFAPDGKQRDETEIDGRVCECCQTSAALTADGPIVAFRDRAADEVRDIHVSRLTAGRWSAPVAVHRDGWKIDGCPVNGPAVSASGRDVVVAWFAVQNTQGHAFIAFSQDAGRTFGAPIRVDDAAAIGRVQVALVTGGAAVTSWIDFTDGRSQFRVRRIERNGTRGPAVTIAEGIGTQYPRMAARSTELVFAWAENTRGSTRVRTAHAVLPSVAAAGR